MPKRPREDEGPTPVEGDQSSTGTLIEISKDISKVFEYFFLDAHAMEALKPWWEPAGWSTEVASFKFPLSSRGIEDQHLLLVSNHLQTYGAIVVDVYDKFYTDPSSTVRIVLGTTGGNTATLVNSPLWGSGGICRLICQKEHSTLLLTSDVVGASSHLTEGSLVVHLQLLRDARVVIGTVNSEKRIARTRSYPVAAISFLDFLGYTTEQDPSFGLSAHFGGHASRLAQILSVNPHFRLPELRLLVENASVEHTYHADLEGESTYAESRFPYSHFDIFIEDFDEQAKVERICRAPHSIAALRILDKIDKEAEQLAVLRKIFTDDVDSSEHLSSLCTLTFRIEDDNLPAILELLTLAPNRLLELGVLGNPTTDQVAAIIRASVNSSRPSGRW